MPVAEAELRPKKASFHLKSADAILAEALAAIGQDSPKSAAARSAVLAVMRKTLAEARKSAEAELMDHGKGLRCAHNLSNTEDEMIRAIHLFAITHVYPVDNPSGAEAICLAAVGGYGPGHAGAGLRHRSAVHPALQADALGRAGHRIRPLYAVG